jgi:hypothetical protein
MGGRKTIGMVVLVVGVVILLLSLTADFIGLGGEVIRFGPRQIASIVVGAIVTVGGLALTLKKPKGIDTAG